MGYRAKAYSPGYSVKKKDVDTFISASPPSQFSYRLLIATANLIGKNARDVSSKFSSDSMAADLGRVWWSLLWGLTARAGSG